MSRSDRNSPRFYRNARGANTSKPRGGGGKVALRGTIRRKWSRHHRGRGRRPSASLFGNPLVSRMKDRFPAGASAKRGPAATPNPSFWFKKISRRRQVSSARFPGWKQRGCQGWRTRISWFTGMGLSSARKEILR
jgi:hypothetical protein